MEPNIKEALSLLIEEGFARAKALEEPKTVTIEGKTHVFYNGCEEIVLPSDPEQPPTFVASTLRGLVDLLTLDPDKLFQDKEHPVTVHVASPTRVEVLSSLTSVERHRTLLVVCNYAAPSIQYSNPMDAERFGVMLQTQFVPSANVDMLLRLVNSMSETNKVERADDGVSQRLTVKSGVDEVDKTVFKNPAYLSPMRTFMEISQPESPFIVRFKDGLRAEICEADGGAWKLEAITLIGSYLRAMLDEIPSIVVIA